MLKKIFFTITLFMCVSVANASEWQFKEVDFNSDLYQIKKVGEDSFIITGEEYDCDGSASKKCDVYELSKDYKEYIKANKNSKDYNHLPNSILECDWKKTADIGEIEIGEVSCGISEEEPYTSKYKVVKPEAGQAWYEDKSYYYRSVIILGIYNEETSKIEYGIYDGVKGDWLIEPSSDYTISFQGNFIEDKNGDYIIPNDYNGYEKIKKEVIEQLELEKNVDEDSYIWEERIGDKIYYYMEIFSEDETENSGITIFTKDKIIKNIPYLLDLGLIGSKLFYMDWNNNTMYDENLEAVYEDVYDYAFFDNLALIKKTDKDNNITLFDGEKEVNLSFEDDWKNNMDKWWRLSYLGKVNDDYVFKVFNDEFTPLIVLSQKEKVKAVEKITCKVVDGKYYGTDGKETDKKTYESVCGVEDNPHTGYEIPFICLVSLGGLGLIINKRKGKNVLNKI